MDETKGMKRRKFRQKLKFNGVSYVDHQKTFGVSLAKQIPPLDRLKRVDKLRIPSDVHEDSDAHPIVCRFRAHYDSILAIANEDGVIEVIDTARSKLRSKKAFTPHPSMISDIAWLSPRVLLSATCPPHNQVSVIDVENGEEIWSKGRLHKGSVKVVARIPYDEDVFASGGRDGDIIVYDKRLDEPVLRIEGAHPKKTLRKAKHGITSLNFRDDNHLVSTASGGGHVHVWDLRRSYNLLREPKPFLRLGANLKESDGFTYAAMCPERQKLYAQCSNNIIYTFDVNSYNDRAVSIFYGHNAGRGEGAYFIKMDVSPSGRYLAIGSPRMDEFCEEQPIPIFDTQKPGHPVYMLKGHYAEPTCPSWSTDLKLVSCGDDQQLILWEPLIVQSEDASDYGYCEPFEEKPLTEKQSRLHDLFNKPSAFETTPRINRTARWSVSLDDWLKNSPTSPPVVRSPLTPLRNQATPPQKRLSSQSSSSTNNAMTPKRKKGSTPVSRQITRFFQKESVDQPCSSNMPN